MDARHVSTATWRTSSVISLLSALKQVDVVAVLPGLEAKTAQSRSVAHYQMERTAHQEEARRNVSAKTVGRASTAMSARRTTHAML